MLCSLGPLALLFSLVPSALTLATEYGAYSERAASVLSTCQLIQSSLPSIVRVSYPGTPSYANATAHWVPNASLPATCTIEPVTASHVSKILQILGGASGVPFGIKSGGHMTSPGQSSTTGVLIALDQFDQVSYHPSNQTVDIGPGQIWDRVYGILADLGRGVVGGRVSGVGVGGYALGGGYAWTSNRYGLCMENVIGYELVLPNGTVVDVTQSSSPELYFGLKGGYNNFGVVTRLTMSTFAQGLIWGGQVTYAGKYQTQVLTALADHAANNTDIDSGLVAAFLYSNSSASFQVTMFYNAPVVKSDVFDKFFAIPAILNTTKQQTFPQYIAASSSDFANAANLRGYLSSARALQLPVAVLDEIASQVKFYASGGLNISGIEAFSAVEPFIPSSIVSKSAKASAWPHSTFVSPIGLNFFWSNANDDAAATAGINNMQAAIEKAASAQGQNVTNLPHYPNYSLRDVTAAEVYGPNLASLKSLVAKYDPQGVMQRCGGFRISP